MDGTTKFGNALIEADREHLVHPAVSWAAHEERGVTILDRAHGPYVVDREGRELLDGFAGLWCVNLGYGQKTLIEAGARQLERLPYATGYFHFGSEPAISLAATLAEHAPGTLDHVFFTLGGSDAVDSAVRFIRLYNNVLGRPEKKHMIALDRGYHGSSTIGSGLTGLAAFHTNFDAPMATQHHIPAPYAYRLGIDGEELIAVSLAALRAKVDEVGADRVAAFFAEPVLGSGGVIVPPAGWLRAMRDACRELDILFVADEVITGFGRTGPLFGCEVDGVEPDLMTLAKGLTSGYAPMGAVILSRDVYQTIAHKAPAGIIGHGLTYSGHPVSAAIGQAALDLYTAPGFLGAAGRTGARLAMRLRALADHPLVGDVRTRGMLAGVELVANKAAKTRLAPDFPEALARTAYEKGLIFRAFADGTVGFAPPLTCTLAEIDELADRFVATLDAMLETPEFRPVAFSR